MIALLLVGAALAQEGPLTLGQARGAAVQTSLAVERARADADAARADAGAALSGALPSIAGFADAGTGAGMTAFGFERPVSNQLGVGVSASWTVVDPGGWAAASAARRSARGQEAMARWAMVDARREATATFAGALSASQIVEARRRALEDAAAAGEAAAALVEGGLRPPVDAARARAEVAAARAALAEAEGEAAASCAALLSLMRRPLDEGCRLAAIDDWAATASDAPPPSEHPALESARYALEAAEASRAGGALELGPTVAVSGQVAEYFFPGGDTDPGVGWSASVGVDQPLFASGAGARGLQSLSAAERAAALSLEEQQRALEVALASAEARWVASEARVQALLEARQAAEEAWRLADERYRAGMSGVTDWIAARRARDEAAVALAAGRAARGAALAELEAARGVW